MGILTNCTTTSKSRLATIKLGFRPPKNDSRRVKVKMTIIQSKVKSYLADELLKVQVTFYV